MTEAVLNFNAGPAMLPRSVLEQVQAELLDYQGLGMSVMEISHRSQAYEAINVEAERRLLRLLGVSEGYRAIFLQGGASLQFAMVPLNFLPAGASADYLISGAWGEKAYEEAAKIGQARVAATTRAGGFRRVPVLNEMELDPHAAYVHITTNETIQGVAYRTWPALGDRPLVADMSSDILAGPLDGRRFALIYGGAQKNLGPSGVTVVVVRESWLAEARADLPTMLQYATHVKTSSLYNTPPVFGVYVLNLVLGWIEGLGGLDALAARNERKASALYETIDSSGGFYCGHAEPDSRSLMNVVFRLPEEPLERTFVAEAGTQGMVGLAGHRSVGGIRASIYNAMELEGCLALAAFMREFQRRHG
jgi:phosphoserine aminotransferase